MTTVTQQKQKSTDSLTASAGLIRPEDVDRLAASPALDRWAAEIQARASSTSTAP